MSVNYKHDHDKQYTNMEPPDDRSTAEDRRLWQHLQDVKMDDAARQAADDAEQEAYLADWRETHGENAGNECAVTILILLLCGATMASPFALALMGVL